MRCPRSRPGFSLVELLVVLAIIALLMGLLVAAVQRAREAANRTRCLSNLRQLGLASHNYHGTHGVFPPGVGNRNGADPYPFLAWGGRLLPFLEQQSLWTQTERAFALDKFFRNNPPHLGVSLVLPVFSCPSDSRTLEVVDFGSNVRVALTAYLGLEGTNQFREDGVLFLDSHVRLADITDGSSSTLFVGERPPSPDRTFGWWYGGWGQSKDGSADMVLGVRERNENTYAECPRGPYEYGPGNLRNPCDTFHFWSLHSGGANFLFADGSVRFLPYSAASIMPALATRSGGETTELP